MSEVSDKVESFFTKYPVRTYPKGQILLFANEDPEHVFYLREGLVRKYDISYRGEKVIVNIFKPNTFFPMSWAISKISNTFFYETETDAVLHVIPPEDAVQFLRDNPDVMFDLLSRIYNGIEGLLGRMVHLMSGTARSRVIYELIIECRRFGKNHNNGKYILETNEVELAARAGLSRETISREIHKLKERDWVSIENRAIVVKDIKLLEKALGVGV